MAEVHIYPDQQQLNHAVAGAIVDCAARDVANAGHFNVALAGGQTPREIYQLLAAPDYRARIPWSGVQVYFGDERCVPPTHSDSNFRMANDALIEKVAIAPNQVHRLEGDASDLDAAAMRYEALLRAQLESVNGWPQFDLVLLGVGGDGHIASLFPDTSILDEINRAVACVHVQKLNSQRLSLTYPVINNARRIFIIAAGSAKADILAYVLGKNSDMRYPVQRVKPRGELHWFLDRAAAHGLPPALRGGR